ncbi:MAG: IS5/IS1182 family transposase, partial [Crocosphaera sp.]|nr:IS5/IS1182 family transposase [Crocosphaera sp.]
NLSKLLRQFLSLFLSLFTNNRTGELIKPPFINFDYTLNNFYVLKLINLSENSWSKVA